MAQVSATHPSDCGCEDCIRWAGREREQTESWRRHVLIEAGYLTGHAAEIARTLEIDLHYAAELVTVHGCDPETAARIIL